MSTKTIGFLVNLSVSAITYIIFNQTGKDLSNRLHIDISKEPWTNIIVEGLLFYFIYFIGYLIINITVLVLINKLNPKDKLKELFLGWLLFFAFISFINMLLYYLGFFLKF
jgi:hypothetical protein